jgi:hypothetical protein
LLVKRLRDPAALALALCCLAGCGAGGPATHPVNGKVVVEGGDVAALVGSNVEFELESDRQVRAYGEILPGGAFELKMLHEGKQLDGAVPGKYRARIVLGGEDEQQARWAREPPVHPRFQEFSKSGLSLTVPASGEVTLKVSRKG